MEEMWGLLTQSPETFKGGHDLEHDCHHQWRDAGNRLRPAGAVLCNQSFSQRRQLPGLPTTGICGAPPLIQFVLAKVAITYGLDFLTKIFAVCNGIVATAAGSIGGADGASITMPTEMIDAINSLGFLESIPLWLVTLLGSLFITVLAFIMILTVYGRFFKLYMYAALSPIALSLLCGGEHILYREVLS